MSTAAATTSQGILTFAIGYAKRGWQVFPCNPQDKATAH